MSEPLMSVAGQLIGIPAEKYEGVSGIEVDQVNKTIGFKNTWTDISDQFTFDSSLGSTAFKSILYSPMLDLVILNIGFSCTSTSSFNALTGPTRYFPEVRLEVQNNGRFIDINRAYIPNLIQVRPGTAGWVTINIIYKPYGKDS